MSRIKRFWILVFLPMLSVQLWSQAQDYNFYFEHTIEARQLLDKNNRKEALQMFEYAFEAVEYPKWYDIREYISVSSSLNQNEKAVNQMRRLVSEYGIIPQRKLLLDSVLYDSIHPVLDNLLMMRIEHMDTIYIQKLSELHYEDQEIRTAKGVFYENGKNSDSLRTLELLKLIENRGFPSVQKLGLKAYNDAMLILLHSDFDLNNDLLGEMMFANVMNGQMEPRNYAAIIDRRCNFRSEKPFYYHAPFGYDELEPAQQKVIKVRRNEIGLRDVNESIKVEILPNGDIKTHFKY